MEALKVAQYILTLSEEESGDGISNLKLQKLLYYVQGFHLAIKGSPLFGDEIKAWQHGPVIPDVYHEYKEFGSGYITKKADDVSDVEDNSDVKEIIDEVFQVYGQFSAWKLREMTHQEPPWTKTQMNQTISTSLMKEYFDTLVVS